MNLNTITIIIEENALDFHIWAEGHKHENDDMDSILKDSKYIIIRSKQLIQAVQDDEVLLKAPLDLPDHFKYLDYDFFKTIFTLFEDANGVKHSIEMFMTAMDDIQALHSVNVSKLAQDCYQSVENQGCIKSECEAGKWEKKNGKYKWVCTRYRCTSD